MCDFQLPAAGQNWGTLTRPDEESPLLPEYDRPDVTCFLWTAARHAVGEISLEEYLEELLSHLIEGARGHEFDLNEVDRVYYLKALSEIDVVATSVKAWMLDPDFKPISVAGESHGWSCITCTKLTRAEPHLQRRKR